MKIELIAAMDKNNGVGFEGGLPWPKLPADMKWFKDRTERWPVIMGRKTWDSLPEQHRPLHNRMNVILTSNFDNLGTYPNAYFGLDLEDALDYVSNWSRVFVIGGASVYETLLPKADAMWITKIKSEFKCDTFFPKFDPDDWNRNWVDYNDEREFDLTLWHYERISK